MGRVMTEEEYDEWRKEREGEKQVSQDTGIDWGMGEIKLSDLKTKISKLRSYLNSHKNTTCL